MVVLPLEEELVVLADDGGADAAFLEARVLFDFTTAGDAGALLRIEKPYGIPLSFTLALSHAIHNFD